MVSDCFFQCAILSELKTEYMKTAMALILMRWPAGWAPMGARTVPAILVEVSGHPVETCVGANFHHRYLGWYCRHTPPTEAI